MTPPTHSVDLSARNEQVMDIVRSPKFRRRFYAKLIDAPDGCHIWTGAVNSSGYGVIGIGCKAIGLGATLGAHRAGWMIQADSVVPEGLQIDHLCRNRLCANPRHLDVVTPSVNGSRKLSIPVGLPIYRPSWRLRDTKSGPPGYQVLWSQIVDGKLRQRGRTFPTQPEAEAFMVAIANAAPRDVDRVNG